MVRGEQWWQSSEGAGIPFTPSAASSKWHAYNDDDGGGGGGGYCLLLRTVTTQSLAPPQSCGCARSAACSSAADTPSGAVTSNADLWRRLPAEAGGGVCGRIRHECKQSQ